MTRLVATLATKQALPDLAVFLRSLALWNPGSSAETPKVYLLCDAAVAAAVRGWTDVPTPTIREGLEPYSGLTRAQMEKRPGTTYDTMWTDFQAEKLNLLEWVFDAEPTAAQQEGVFYMDADITLLGGLPTVPATAAVGLSPHLIRPADEAKFGTYNGGFVWMRDRGAIAAWRAACRTSRFFEQAALEVFDESVWQGRVHHFPVQVNYGWWRLWQGRAAPADLMAKWGVFRSKETSGITVGGQPLLSVHTHWVTNDFATREFNEYVLSWLRKLARSHPPAGVLLRILGGGRGQN